MVVQRVRISLVVGRGGTLGAMEAASLSLELSELVLELQRSERLLLPLLLTLGCGEAAGLPMQLSLKLEDSLLVEKMEKLILVLVSELESSLSICVCVQVSERTSRDRAS